MKGRVERSSTKTKGSGEIPSLSWTCSWEAEVAERTSPIAMEEVSDPTEVSKAQIRRELFDRNFAWLRTHASEVYDKYRGKCTV